MNNFAVKFIFLSAICAGIAFGISGLIESMTQDPKLAHNSGVLFFFLTEICLAIKLSERKADQ